MWRPPARWVWRGRWRNISDGIYLYAGLAVTMQQAGAFALPAASKDAVLVLNLTPGLYTAQVSGVGGATGSAIVEIYDLGN